MIKEETVNGMRFDTFLVNSKMLSNERGQTHKTQKQELEIAKNIADVFDPNRSLPPLEKTKKAKRY